jgi:hypothetical protein
MSIMEDYTRDKGGKEIVPGGARETRNFNFIGAGFDFNETTNDVLKLL